MHPSTRKFIPRMILPTGMFLVLIGAATAQTRVIKGRVVDENSQPIEAVQVVIQGMNITQEFKVKTDKNGQYLYLLGRESGVYRVIARRDGYSPEFLENVKPELGEETEVNFQLIPGQDYKLPFEMSEEEKAEYLRRYEELQEKRKVSDEIRGTVKLAMELSREGKHAEAIEEYKKAIERMPDEPAIHGSMGDSYAKLGQNEEALAAYQKAVSLNTIDPAVYANMGLVLNAMGKIDESQEAFKKAAELDPASAAQNYYNIGITLINSGKSAEAAEAFQQAIAADEGYAEAYYQLGMSLSGSSETIPDAVEALETYIKIGQKPDQVEVAKQIIEALGGQ